MHLTRNRLSIWVQFWLMYMLFPHAIVPLVNLKIENRLLPSKRSLLLFRISFRHIFWIFWKQFLNEGDIYFYVLKRSFSLDSSALDNWVLTTMSFRKVQRETSPLAVWKRHCKKKKKRNTGLFSYVTYFLPFGGIYGDSCNHDNQFPSLSSSMKRLWIFKF